MYLKASNLSSATSNGIPADTEAYITNFSVSGPKAIIQEVHFSSANDNPFGSDLTITGITKADRPTSGSYEFIESFVDASPNLAQQVQLWRSTDHSDSGRGMIINRSNDQTFANANRRTAAQLDAAVDTDDNTIPDSLATVGTRFRLVDQSGTVLTYPMTVESTALHSDGWEWIRANVSTVEEIEGVFRSEDYYSLSASFDFSQPTGTQWRIEIFSNSTDDAGGGVWELYNYADKVIKSN